MFIVLHQRGHQRRHRIGELAVGGEHGFAGSGCLDLLAAQIEDVGLVAAVAQQIGDRGGQCVGGRCCLKRVERLADACGRCCEAVAHRWQQVLVRIIGGLDQQPQREVRIGAQIEHRLQRIELLVGDVGQPLLDHLGVRCVVGDALQTGDEGEIGIVNHRRQFLAEAVGGGADCLRHRHALVAQRQSLADRGGQQIQVAAQLFRGLTQRRRRLLAVSAVGERGDDLIECVLIACQRRDRRVALGHVGGGQYRRRRGRDLRAAFCQPQREAHGWQIVFGDATQGRADIVVGQHRDDGCQDGQAGDAAEREEQLAPDAQATLAGGLGGRRNAHDEPGPVQPPALARLVTGLKLPSGWMTMRKTWLDPRLLSGP